MANSASDPAHLTYSRIITYHIADHMTDGEMLKWLQTSWQGASLIGLSPEASGEKVERAFSIMTKFEVYLEYLTTPL